LKSLLPHYATHIVTNFCVSKKHAVTFSIVLVVCTSPFSSSWLIVDLQQSLRYLAPRCAICINKNIERFRGKIIWTFIVYIQTNISIYFIKIVIIIVPQKEKGGITVLPPLVISTYTPSNTTFVINEQLATLVQQHISAKVVIVRLNLQKK
jgi:hypothetical protein